jgi:hypothetical protein
VGFLWGSAAVSLSCGVSVGARRSPRLGRPTGTAYPSPADFRILMTTSQVPQYHWSDLPACRNSAPDADYLRLTLEHYSTPRLAADTTVLCAVLSIQ